MDTQLQFHTKLFFSPRLAKPTHQHYKPTNYLDVPNDQEEKKTRILLNGGQNEKAIYG